MRPTRLTSSAKTSPDHATVEHKTKILRFVLALTVLSFFTFLITLTSSRWISVAYPSGFFLAQENLFVSRFTYGIIWECLLSGTKNNSIYENKCDYHQNRLQNPTTVAEHTLIGMIRTMQSFSVIHILLAIITFICGLYSIHDHRYTYKRLTGMIYILTAASLVVCIEVLSTIFRDPHIHLGHLYPAGATYSYGSCYIIAWLIFIQLLCSSFLFFACSKKRKGTFDEATEEEALANRPVDLGRSFRS